MAYFETLDHLRDYQQEATTAVEDAFKSSRSALIVLPTGTGKTQTFLTIAGRHASRAGGRALIIGHRSELIHQPFDRWKQMTGEYAEIEMGGHRRNTRATSPLVCASKDSLHPDRLRQAFPDPREVSLIVIDEAHRCVRKNATYSATIDYFLNGNPDCRLLGATATPDRADEEALGQQFETVAYEYSIFDPDGGPAAINDGWLVPLRQEVAIVENVQLDAVAVDGNGDLRAAALEREMNAERPLQRIAGATRILCYGEKSLVFTSGRAHAAKVAEILNRERARSAFALVSGAKDAPGWVVDAGDEDARRKVLRAYARGDFPYLINMGVLTEGFDDPAIMNLVMGRPTKSRALYAQMVGRGTRILPGVVEGKNDDGTFWRLDRDDRIAAIAESDKPFCRVIDFSFTGNTKHSLISSLDILGGNTSPEVLARASRNVSKAGAGHVIDELKRAAAELAAERRASIRATMDVQTVSSNAILNPLDVVAISTREPGWAKGKEPSDRQKAALEKFGLRRDEVARMSHTQASRMMGELIRRARGGMATYRQSVVLTRNGKDINVTRAAASAMIDEIMRQNPRGARAPRPDQAVRESDGVPAGAY